ncbi:MAG: hypothetical protein ACRAVC_12785 [Trichormus sp.]
MVKNWYMVVAMLGLLLTASLSITPSPSIAEEICRNIGFVPPSETTRLVKFDKFGIQIKMPSNFRTMLLNDGTLEIIDSATFEILQCKARGGKVLFPHGYAPFRIKLIPNPQDLTPLDFAKRVRKYQGKTYTYKLDGIDVVIIESISQMAVGAWFIVPGINGVVEMETSCDCETTKEDMVLQLDNTELIKKEVDGNG